MKRILGLLLVILSAASLVLTVVSIFAVWNYRQQIAASTTAGLKLLDDTLSSTTAAFVTVDEALRTANASVVSAQDTFEALASTVSSSSPTLDSLSKFLTEGLPDTLRTTQETLDASAQSAEVIDSVLQGLASIPLLGISYDPTVSLSDSLEGIGKTLETLPDSLDGLGDNLSTTSATLPELAKSLDSMGNSIGDLTTNLQSAQQVMTAYKDLVGRYQASIRTLNNFIPTAASAGPVIFTFFAFWLAVVQAGALLKGWNWLRTDREPEATSGEPA